MFLQHLSQNKNYSPFEGRSNCLMTRENRGICFILTGWKSSKADQQMICAEL